MKKTFGISYKLRYHETDEWGTEYLRAATKKQALDNFAKMRKIRTKKFKSFKDWMWEEGVWLAQFKHIKQVEVTKCRRCGGTGVIHT